MTPWYERTIVGFDVETTGVDRDKDRIVTATITLEPFGGALQTYEYLANSGVEIPPEVTAIHGITNEFVAEFGQPADKVIENIVSNLASMLSDQAEGETMPLAVYNAPFDLTMLDREARRYGLEPLSERIAPGLGTFGLGAHVVCPLTIDKALNPYVKGSGMRKLTPTCARYGIELKDAHNATADTIATGRLARALVVDQPRDDQRIRARRAQLRTASMEELGRWQEIWYQDQKLSLAAYFARSGKAEAAESCRSEAPHFPMVPFAQLVD